MTEPATFAPRLLEWFDRHGRHDLPWQHPRTPYRVWLAEIMLQQTQVATVIPYFRRFVTALPDLAALARAESDQVLALWSGLGYYARARNLQRAARVCMAEHGGELPREAAALTALPGIGRSTAAAILAQAHGDRLPILDGNVKRLLCRLFAIDGWPGSRPVENRLWPLAGSLLPAARLADYTQAMMDFGATLCRRSAPDCSACPFLADCRARNEGRIAELPSPRPARALPARRCAMALLQADDGRVLLERRPPVGVWSGLWSLPQFDDEAGCSDWAQGAGGSGDGEPLPAIEHVFSHFRLRIQPLRWRCRVLPAAIADNDRLRWTDHGQLPDLGLPAPVRRLLEQALQPASPVEPTTET
jgi:A/G-specific adenine glycosylase